MPVYKVSSPLRAMTISRHRSAAAYRTWQSCACASQTSGTRSRARRSRKMRAARRLCVRAQSANTRRARAHCASLCPWFTSMSMAFFTPSAGRRGGGGGSGQALFVALSHPAVGHVARFLRSHCLTQSAWCQWPHGCSCSKGTASPPETDPPQRKHLSSTSSGTPRPSPRAATSSSNRRSSMHGGAKSARIRAMSSARRRM
mmetsp:Transcript_14497/g.37308  ORF Transcript_14497/g.37308 Transcript_14497/m.37308 type:complete len:201 (+) Transcript_14497:571-1173(+)